MTRTARSAARPTASFVTSSPIREPWNTREPEIAQQAVNSFTSPRKCVFRLYTSGSPRRNRVTAGKEPPIMILLPQVIEPEWPDDEPKWRIQANLSLARAQLCVQLKSHSDS